MIRFFSLCIGATLMVALFIGVSALLLAGSSIAYDFLALYIGTDLATVVMVSLFIGSLAGCYAWAYIED